MNGDGEAADISGLSSENGVVAVTGSTGALGGRVAAQLAKRGVPQRLVVRDPARAPRIPGAEVAAADYGDAAALRAALDGVDTLFMVSAPESRERVALHKAAVDAAVAAGVRRIVYLSFLAAAPDATFTFARDHYATEQHIRGTGAAFAFVRPSLYMDLVPYWVSDDGVIAGPAGDGRVALVCRDDLADSIATVIATAGHDGATYDLTGDPAVTLAEAAEVLSGFAGRPIRYHAETLDEARASRAGYGAEPWEVEGWVTSYAAIATGEMATVSDAVQRLTGHPPQTLSEYLKEHPEACARLRG